MTSFEKWVRYVDSDVAVVQGLMEQPLSDNPAALSQQLAKIEAWNARINYHCAKAHDFLRLGKARELGKIRSGEKVSVKDMEILLDEGARAEYLWVEILERQAKCIRERIMACMSLLKQRETAYGQT